MSTTEPPGWPPPAFFMLHSDIPRAASDPALAQVLDEADEEMSMHRRFGDCYSYIFLVLRK